MSWKYTGIVIAFMVMVFIEDTVGKDEDAALKALTFMEKNIRICFNKNDAVLTDYDNYQLDIEDNTGDNINMKPIPLKSPSTSELGTDPICLEGPDDCLTPDDISYLTTKNIKFILHIQKKGTLDPIPLMVTGVVSQMPATLPVAALIHDISIIGTSSGDRIIKIMDKIEGDGSLFLNDEDLILTCDTVPCFSKQTVDTTKGKNFAICAKKNDDIPVCGMPKDGKEIEDTGLLPVTISVNYDDSVTFGLTTAATGGVAIQDVISQDASQYCSSPPTNCVLENLKGKVVLVDYTSSKFDEYNVVDRELSGFVFGTTPNSVVEVMWSTVGCDTYEMSRSNAKTSTIAGNTKETFHKANVDCSAFPDHICNAYFTDVEIGSHVITIKEIENWGTGQSVGEDNWKKTAPVNTKTRDVRMIHVDSNAITMTETNIELDVCFKYVLNISRESTHYEFLAVNSKGKWKKEIGDKKKDETHACFHGLELPLADFSESSNLFVLLRDSDNGKPLASGEVTFDLPAVRAIKPEVDNGNNGSTSTLAIVGAAITGIACLMALVAAAVMFVMKINRNNDGLQYPLQHNNIEDSSTIHGLDNSIPTM